jgi:hypothetical protein
LIKIEFHDKKPVYKQRRKDDGGNFWTGISGLQILSSKMGLISGKVEKCYKELI